MEKEERKLTPKEVLKDSFLYELYGRGIKTDEQIEAYLIEQFRLQGRDINNL